jgi:hypothetical protein
MELLILILVVVVIVSTHRAAENGFFLEPELPASSLFLRNCSRGPGCNDCGFLAV